MNTLKKLSIVCTSLMTFAGAMMPAAASTMLSSSAEGIVSSFGDVNRDGRIDSSDASVILAHYASTSTGGSGVIAKDILDDSDVNSDGKVDSSDASVILGYYAAVATGSHLTLQEFVNKPSHPSAPVAARGGWSMKTKETYDTCYTDIVVGPDVYTRADIQYRTDAVCEAIEAVTGLKFNGGAHPHRPTITVERGRDPETDEIDYETECGFGYEMNGDVFIGPSYLYIGKTNTIVHELIHSVAESAANKYAGTVLTEGFAEYNTLRVMEYLCKNDPATAYTLGQPFSVIFNNDYSFSYVYDMYSKDPTYWFSIDNTEAKYCYGLHIMAYLDDVYGDCTKWLDICNDTEYEGDPNTELQLSFLKKAYGDDVLDKFYEWNKAHEDFFKYSDDVEYDMTGLEYVDLYPDFNGIGPDCSLFTYRCNAKYSDLTVYLDMTRSYIGEYKGIDTSDLLLSTDAGMMIFYDKNCSEIKRCSGTKNISLEGVEYIELVGNGTMTYFTITGIDPENEQIPGITGEWIDSEWVFYKDGVNGNWIDFDGELLWSWLDTES